MQPNVNRRILPWWPEIPFITSIILIICAIIYVVCLLVGYDSLEHVCFLPIAITSHYEVYRPYTATLFHDSAQHLLSNMLALVQISSGLERILGSVKYSHLLFLIATSNGILHLLIAVIIAHNPFHPDNPIMYQCSIGFSGMLFAMTVMETSLSGAQIYSIFGLFDVPAKWYAWILLIFFQILIPNVSFLGHLCGILSGLAYTYGLFNPLLLGPSTYSMIESTAIIIFHHSARVVGNLWRNRNTWVPRRETPLDERFPGRGRTLAEGAATSNRSTPRTESGLQTRLLERDVANGHPELNHAIGPTASLNSRSRQDSQVRQSTSERFPRRGRTLAEGVAASNRSTPRTESGLQTRLLERDVANGHPELNHAIGPTASLNSRSHQDFQVSQSTSEDFEHHADLISNLVAMGFEKLISSLVAMGFEKEKAEIAIHAAKGDLAMAVEILSSEPCI